MPFSFSIPKPADMHAHLRDGAMMDCVVPLHARQFAYTIAMPNLKPPVNSLERIDWYYKELKRAAGDEIFEPLMVVYWTKDLTPKDIENFSKDPRIKGIKFYPEGGTTNAEAGLQNPIDYPEMLEAMEHFGLRLLMHGEVPREGVDEFDREPLFLEEAIRPMLKQYPRLKIISEHLSTAVMADFMRQEAPENMAATLTPHHLLFTVEEVRENPLLWCKPEIKTKKDREALLKLLKSDHPRVFAGTDSAPHPLSKKAFPKPNFGVYNGAMAVSLYAQIFDDLLDLEKKETQEVFERFMIGNAAQFYDLKIPSEAVLIKKVDQIIPSDYTLSGDQLVSPWAGGKIIWSCENK